MIIGTAGHVDHGKSALVTALTGQPMDRLAEERRRGITIDLNFASLELAGALAGIVDVPGHEDFVRTMVAGASGVDVALLVVAADEGVMPQTREHLLVLEQLHVPAAIAVITKADIVDPDWLDLVQAEVAGWLRPSPISFGEPVVVSARTGQGIEALRARLGALALTTTRRAAGDLFRLPVDRAFTVHGTGTVVTGTAESGCVTVGDRVRLLPSGVEARVRSIESFGVALETSAPGARTAVALNGLERNEVTRGDVLVATSSPWEATMRLDAELSLAPNAPEALSDRMRVRVHHGSSEVMARVRLDAPVERGGRAVARLRLEAPLVARGGDRLVLRSYSPMTVIGGGRVLDPIPVSRRRTSPTLASDDPAIRLEALVRQRRLGLELRLLPIVLGLPPHSCSALVAGSATLLAAGDTLFLRSDVERMTDTLETQVQAFHAREPHEAGMPAETLRRVLRVPDAVAVVALGMAERAGRLRMGGGIVSAPTFQPLVRASEAHQELVLLALRQAGLAPPTVSELAERLQLETVSGALDQAALLGLVVPVGPDRYVTSEALEGFAALLREVGAGGAEVTPGGLRDRTGLSRKYLIPLLEWADRSGITVRLGDARRLQGSLASAAPGA